MCGSMVDTALIKRTFKKDILMSFVFIFFTKVYFCTSTNLLLFVHCVALLLYLLCFSPCNTAWLMMLCVPYVFNHLSHAGVVLNSLNSSFSYQPSFSDVRLDETLNGSLLAVVWEYVGEEKFFDFPPVSCCNSKTMPARDKVARDC